jgi:hypothetical protein
MKFAPIIYLMSSWVVATARKSNSVSVLTRVKPRARTEN